MRHNLFAVARLSELRRRPHFVYRCFDVSGALLYVGCTHDVDKRLNRHRAEGSPWYPDMDLVVSREYPDFYSARRAESLAIGTEHPGFNVLHNGPGARQRVNRRRNPRVMVK